MKGRFFGAFSVAALGMALVPSLSQAQVATRELEREAAFPDSYSLISGIRELPDGRLLLADPLGQALAIVDLDAGTADTIGGVGAGPDEYRQPDGVFALPGDSTLLVDLGNGRLVVVHPNLEFGETYPIGQGDFRPGAGGGLTIVLPRVVDERGRVYVQQQPRPGQPRDSAYVLRWDRAGEEFERVARVKLQDTEEQSSGGARNRSVTIRPVPYSAQDSWTVAPDGRIAVVRATPYHVEWINPTTGAVTSGPEVPFDPVRVRDPEKEEYVDAASSNGLAVSIGVDNGVPRMSFARGGGQRPETDGYTWPDHKPPFVANRAWVTPEGDLWVERSVAADAPREFDVFGPDARLKERVTLPAGRRVVGFGAATVYVASRDEFDLEWLERYRRTT